MKIERATEAQCRAYKGLYPLHGFIRTPEGVLTVEDLRGTDPDIKFEVLAPRGVIFNGDLHSMLCDSERDVLDRVAQEPPEVCTCGECVGGEGA